MIKIDIISKSLPALLIFLIFSVFVSACSTRSLKKSRKDRIQEKREMILDLARDQIGVKYRYAGKTPRGFDCSGYTSYVFRKAGIDLYASSRKQSKQGKFRDLNKARPGDLIFFGNAFKIDHVGIVTQNKRGKLYVIHSTNSQGVVEHDINQILYWKKRAKFARDVISP